MLHDCLLVTGQEIPLSRSGGQELSMTHALAIWYRCYGPFYHRPMERFLLVHLEVGLLI